jgi:hypothetical protein
MGRLLRDRTGVIVSGVTDKWTVPELEQAKRGSYLLWRRIVRMEQTLLDGALRDDGLPRLLSRWLAATKLRRGKLFRREVSQIRHVPTDWGVNAAL